MPEIRSVARAIWFRQRAITAGLDGSGEAVAPRLKLADLKGRSLMIHSGTDNYSDAPEKYGGSGERIACGVMPCGRYPTGPPGPSRPEG